MKKILVSFGVVLLLAVPVLVAAQNTKDTLEQRIARKKTEQKIVISPAEKSKLVTTCKGAQSAVFKMQTNVAGDETKKLAVYKIATDKIETLETRLKGISQIDSSAFSATVLDTKKTVEKFKSDVADLKNSLEDIFSINCVADVEGFKALLESSRSSYKIIKQDSVDIQKSLAECKKALAAIRSKAVQ